MGDGRFGFPQVDVSTWGDLLGSPLGGPGKVMVHHSWVRSLFDWVFLKSLELQQVEKEQNLKVLVWKLEV